MKADRSIKRDSFVHPTGQRVETHARVAEFLSFVDDRMHEYSSESAGAIRWTNKETLHLTNFRAKLAQRNASHKLSVFFRE